MNVMSCHIYFMNVYECMCGHMNSEQATSFMLQHLLHDLSMSCSIVALLDTCREPRRSSSRTALHQLKQGQILVPSFLSWYFV